MICVWEPDPACLTEEFAKLDIPTRDRSLMLATSSLQMLTLYRVGTCPITVRPCPKPVDRECGCWNPTLWNGVWLNRSCAHDPRAMPCGYVNEVVLDGPVGYIDQVKVNGQVLDLDSGDFRMDNGNRLVWQGDGPSPFLETQDLTKADTEVGTWSVTYSKSHAVEEDGAIAVAYLAMEFAKACKGKGKCSLPRGVTNVVRNGVSFSIEAGLFPGGLTGIEVVDAYILKWAPAGAPTRTATVFDPKKALATRTTAGVPRRPPATPPII
jgi:hypothetical protein